MKNANAAVKSAKTKTSVSNPAKGATSPEKKEKLQTKNLESAKDEVKEKAEREAIYQYPSDVKTKSQKKDFRRKARAEAAKFSKQLEKLGKSKDPADAIELKKVRKEFKAWKDATLSSSHKLMQPIAE